ncbi:MAG TPA: lipoprotein insertase outer membrane protein LolB [Burkholderiaceae bacterium]|nr:lipoprotein insertase outer membrane protein LolB [Burkholderiaceae bacterium]
MFLLTGCASLAPPGITETASAEQAHAPRIFHDAIKLDGRLSLQYQRNDNEEAVHGGFTWTQAAGQAQVTLLSPLGQTIAAIEVTPESALLRQANQPPHSAADVDMLVADTLGWPLPISGLRQWLQGFAVDANGRRFVATPSSSAVTTRDGWRIRYVSWESDTPSAPLRPKRIDLERHTAQAGDISIRIVIGTWQID